MDYLPVFLDLRGRTALLVGGGRVALRKAELLAAVGARLRVVAPRILPELAQLVAASGGECHPGRFAPQHLDGVVLAIVATGVAEVDAAVQRAAVARALPVNVADRQELCSFILPAVVDRSPVIVAFSTGGRAPVLARALRARLEAMLPAGLGRLAGFLGSRRDWLRERVPAEAVRRRIWERLVNGPAAERVLAGDEAGAERLLAQEVATGGEAPQGEVYLVGAGPGDPDLLSFRALRLMQQADIVFYDRLVAPEVLALVRREAERVYVGKTRGAHAVAQPRINELLAEQARLGKRVLRLKGGDPFIFGRGGEEIEHLADAGIPFQVVPGITAASGCAAYAGIPLTHRDHAQSVRFVTGHLRDGSVDLDWEALARPGQTLVFYMGLVGLPVICGQLIAHGLTPDTPVALIQQGTTPAQRVLVSTLREMPRALATSGLRAPTLTIVGTVVGLHARLQWFRPGEGKDQG
ncbi:MAG: Siroheme synthase [Pseudomonadales bacterium]|nr:Siroheme synthase [Pseudomonadales bacterium]